MRRPEQVDTKYYHLGTLLPPGMQKIHVQLLDGENLMLILTYNDGSQRLMHLKEYIYYYEKYLFPVGAGPAQGQVRSG